MTPQCPRCEQEIDCTDLSMDHDGEFVFDDKCPFCGLEIQVEGEVADIIWSVSANEPTDTEVQ